MLSRREFFEYLARPVTRATKRLAASEQRARAVQLMRQVSAEVKCTRCYAPYHAEHGESLCPDCLAAELKNQTLMKALFKDK